jgi:hypothetical protein
MSYVFKRMGGQEMARGGNVDLLMVACAFTWANENKVEPVFDTRACGPKTVLVHGPTGQEAFYFERAPGAPADVQVETSVTVAGL